MSAHAIIAPSSLARIVQCPGSLQMCKPFENTETEEAIEGTVAHYVAMLYALNDPGLPVVGHTIDGVRVDREMIAGARMYAEALEGFAGNPEQTIPIKRIHDTQCSGTPDFWQYSAVTKTLRVTDYKYGHKYVEVFQNWQLLAYAVGLVDMLVERGELLEYETIVEFLLVQPRCYSADSPVRSWRTSASNLRAFANQARAAAEDALGSNPKTRSGPECLYCPARAVCKTAHVASTAILEYAGRVETMVQTSADVGLRLNLINGAIEMLRAVQTGLEEQAVSMLRAGKQVPHFKIGYSKPRETWVKTVAEVEMLGNLTGKKLTELTYAVTPKQAVALGIDRAVISAYSVTPNGAARLEPDKLTDAARIFSK